MTRFLAILLLVLLAWWVLEKLLKLALATPRGRQLSALLQLIQNARRAGATTAGGGNRTTTRPGRLVRCAVCGTHVLEERALVVDAGPPPIRTCSQACRQRYESGG